MTREEAVLLYLYMRATYDYAFMRALSYGLSGKDLDG